MASEFRDVDDLQVRTDAEGRFEARFETGGLVRVRARAPGYEDQIQHLSVPAPPFVRTVSFHLGLKDRGTTTITGRVVDRGGAPLAREDLHFLLPKVSGEEEMLEPVDSVSAILALLDREDRDESRIRPAEIDGEKGTFEILVSRGWRGVVALFFRDRIVEERGWQDGDPGIEFRVDLAPLLRELGGLEVRVVDGSTGDPAPDARVRIEREEYFGEFHRDMDFRAFLLPRAETLRVWYLPAGRVEVFARAPGFAEGCAAAEVRPGGQTQVVIGLERPAEVRLRLVPLDGWLPPRAETSAAYHDEEGRWRDVPSRVEGQGGIVRVVFPGVPPGEGYLVVAGNARKVRLSPGPNPEIEFPIRRERGLKLRWRAPAGPEDVPASTWRICVLFDGRVPLSDFRFTPTPGSDGWVERTDAEIPPGRYMLELQRGAGTIVRREIDVGEEEQSTVVLDG